MSDEELLQLWKTAQGDTEPEPWTEQSVFAFFQWFRPLGTGVEAAIEVLPHGREILRRLLTVYSATAEGFECDGTVDAYFTVNKPIPSTTVELEQLVRRQSECWARMVDDSGTGADADCACTYCMVLDLKLR